MQESHKLLELSGPRDIIDFFRLDEGEARLQVVLPRALQEDSEPVEDGDWTLDPAVGVITLKHSEKSDAELAEIFGEEQPLADMIEVTITAVEVGTGEANRGELRSLQDRNPMLKMTLDKDSFLHMVICHTGTGGAYVPEAVNEKMEAFRELALTEVQGMLKRATEVAYEYE